MVLYAGLKHDTKNIDFDGCYAKQMVMLQAQRGRQAGYLDKADLEEM